MPVSCKRGRLRLVSALVTVVTVAAMSVGCAGVAKPGSKTGSGAVTPTAASAVIPAGAQSPPEPQSPQRPSPQQDQRPAETASVLASQPADEQPAGAVLACDGTRLVAPAASDLEAAVARVAQQQGARVAVSWVDPVRGIVTAGGLSELPAWSTVKVPLSLAVIVNGDSEVLRPSITAALRSSDNEAADRLWRSLGDNDDTRASAVTSVLRQTGDQTTTVPRTLLRPGFSVFGQTQWLTSAQVQFVQKLPCLAGANQVISDMGSVVASQRWGLGTLSGATFKGGWGPTTAGGYTVRQFGWYVDQHGSRVPVAIAVQASSFEAGVATANALASALG